jgi:hypothetical protein
MAQQPYMGLGLLFPRLLAGWRLGWEMEALNLAYVTFLFMPVRFFYMP